MGFNYLRPPIGETIFNKSGIINEVWNKFFNEIVGIEQFKELEGIVANHVLVGYDISSTDYVAGTSGWRIASDSGSGVAEFNIPIISYEQLTGTIAAAVGGVGAAGLTGETSGDMAVRFWAGSTFANRATAPFRVLQNGTTYMTGAVVDSTSTLNGTATSTVVSNATAGATFTSSNAGALAYLSTVGTSQIDTTVISGGKIVTGLLTASNIQTGTLNCNSISLSGNISSAVSGSYYNLTSGNMYFATSGYIYFGGSTSYGAIWGNASQLRLTYGSSYPNIGLVSGQIELETATSRIVYAGGSFYPFTGETVSLGAAGKDFNTLYISAVLLNGTQIHDALDDLDTLHSVKALPDGKMNLLTLPKEFTSFDLAKAQLIKQSGDMLSPEDAEAALLDHDDMAHMVSLNLGEFVNLIEGAVRQLDRESSEVQYETLDWLNDIDKRLKKIEKGKSNA